MIKVVTNNLGSGDWIMVIDDVGTVWSGHSVKAQDLVDILKTVLHRTVPISLVEVTDEQMEEQYS